MGDVSKEYDKLAVKHKLPSFKALTEFDVESIESDANILSSVRHKIADRLHDCTDFVSDLLQPDTNLVTMYESEAIPEDEKPEVYNLFRRLMYWRRASFEASSTKMGSPLWITFSTTDRLNPKSGPEMTVRSM